MRNRVILFLVLCLFPSLLLADERLSLEITALEEEAAEGGAEIIENEGLPFIRLENDSRDFAILPMGLFYRLEEVRKISGPQFQGENLEIGEPFKMEFRARWRKWGTLETKRFDRFLRQYSSPSSNREFILFLYDRFFFAVDDMGVGVVPKFHYVLPRADLGGPLPEFHSLFSSMELIQEKRRRRSSVFRDAVEFTSELVTEETEEGYFDYYQVDVLGKVVVNRENFRILHAVSDMHFDMYLRPFNEDAASSLALFLNVAREPIGKVPLLSNVVVSSEDFEHPSQKDTMMFLNSYFEDENFDSTYSHTDLLEMMQSLIKQIPNH